MKKSLLEKLQSLDERTKHFIVIVGTMLTMTVIVYAWLGYFNTLTAKQPELNAGAEAGLKGFTLWGSIKGSTAVLYQNTIGTLSSLLEFFEKPREYIVEPAK